MSIQDRQHVIRLADAVEAMGIAISELQRRLDAIEEAREQKPKTLSLPPKNG